MMPASAPRRSRRHRPRRSAGIERRLLARLAGASLPDWLWCALVLLLALLLGGGTRQGLWSDAAVQLASLPLLAVSLWRLAGMPARAVRPALWLLAATFIIPALQLVPLPPGLWTSLPGREPIAAAFTASGTPLPLLGISLSPGATWRCLLSLLPAAALFVATLLLGYRGRRAIAYGVIAFALLSVLLGLAQLAQGPDSALRFYSVTNPSETVGFFANRNHFAALLYCAIPVTAAAAVGLAADRRPEMAFGLALCLLVLVVLLLGLGMSRSRAGLILAVLGGFGSMALTRSWGTSGTQRHAARMIFAGISIGIILFMQFAAIGIFQRLDIDLAASKRLEFARTTLQAARDFLPFGSGFGTFEAIYRMRETADQIYAAYVNHAHNDYVELLLEGGLPAVAVLIAFLVWYLRASLRVWRAPANLSLGTFDRALPRTASIVVLLLLLHSIVDYPLRTTALEALLAIACGLLVPPLRSKDAPQSARRRTVRATA